MELLRYGSRRNARLAFTSASVTGTTYLVLAFAVPCHDDLVLAGNSGLNSELLSSATG